MIKWAGGKLVEDRMCKLRETKISSWNFFLELLKFLEEKHHWLEEVADESHTTGLQQQFCSLQSKARWEAERLICSSLTKEGWKSILTAINSCLVRRYKEHSARFNSKQNKVMKQAGTQEILSPKNPTNTYWGWEHAITVCPESLHPLRHSDTALSNLQHQNNMLW